MDLEYNDPRTGKFTSNIGLITSNGANGQNIMACEWTRHVSYAPSMMAVHIGPGKATDENIEETKEFGVNLASITQNVISSIAGGSSGRNIDKIAVLKEYGAEFYKAKTINVLMLKDASMNAECKLVNTIKLGDHTMLIGEVTEISISDVPSLSYQGGKYWKLGEQIQKPPQEELDKIKEIVEKHKK